MLDLDQNSWELAGDPAAVSKRFIQTADRKQTQMYKWFKSHSLVKTLSGEHSVQICKANFFFLLHPMSTEKVFSSLN